MLFSIDDVGYSFILIGSGVVKLFHAKWKHDKAERGRGLMLNVIREKVKSFLKETIESREADGEIRVIGINRSDDHWVAEAKVAERNMTLPGYRLFENKRYVITLTDNLDIISYKQVKNTEENEEK